MADELVIKINGDVKKYRDALKKVKAETADLEAGRRFPAHLAGGGKLDVA